MGHQAERFNAEAAAVGDRLRDRTIWVLATAQLFALRWSQGRAPEVEDRIRDALRFEKTPAWPAGLALIHCGQGREHDARRELERLAVNGFQTLPRYNGWLVTLASPAR